MLGSEVTNKQTGHDPYFENHKTATKRPLIQILCFPSVAIMALHRNVLQQGNILCEYNSVRLAKTLLDRNVRVCGTMRANRGIPRDLEGKGKRLKKEKSAFLRNGVSVE